MGLGARSALDMGVPTFLAPAHGVANFVFVGGKPINLIHAFCFRHVIHMSCIVFQILVTGRSSAGDNIYI